MVDARPDYMKLLIDQLGFRVEKITYLQDHHNVISFETFFDVYSPETEGGLYRHEFKPLAKEIEEEKDDQESE